jgi:hypothetical protein
MKRTYRFFISLAAGLFVLCVDFPTDNIAVTCCNKFPYSVSTLKDSTFRKAFHYAPAGIFLGCLA